MPKDTGSARRPGRRAGDGSGVPDMRGGGAGQGRRREHPRGGRGSRAGESLEGGSRVTGSPTERGGPRLAPKKPRRPEPRIPEGVTGRELDRSVHQQLRTLSKENAEGVAQHLVMVAALLAADDVDAAMAHAETAVRRAGRVGAAREALGMVAYRMGDYARALAEFRTVRRLTGSHHLLPLMVDCERGLGRPARALELAATPEARALTGAEGAELAIVVAGVRRDLGEDDAALIALQIPELRRRSSYRLHYAYADLLAHLGRVEEARIWFSRAAQADLDLETDAVERLEEMEGTWFVDLDPDGPNPDDPDPEDPNSAGGQPADTGLGDGPP